MCFCVLRAVISASWPYCPVGTLVFTCYFIFYRLYRLCSQINDDDDDDDDDEYGSLLKMYR